MGARSLDDIMYDEETKRYAQAFEGQAQHAVFYAYLKLKEQEIRNIVWLGEMIARKLPKNHPGWKKVIVPFSHFKWSYNINLLFFIFYFEFIDFPAFVLLLTFGLNSGYVAFAAEEVLLKFEGVVIQGPSDGLLDLELRSILFSIN